MTVHEPQRLRVRISQSYGHTSSSSSLPRDASPTSVRQSLSSYAPPLKDFDCEEQQQSHTAHTPKPLSPLSYRDNWLSSLFKSMQMLLVSKSKLRYLLGFYTFMITVFLHYSGCSVMTLVSDFGNGGNGNMLGHTSVQSAAAPVSVTSTMLQSQAQSTHPST